MGCSDPSASDRVRPLCQDRWSAMIPVTDDAIGLHLTGLVTLLDEAKVTIVLSWSAALCAAFSRPRLEELLHLLRLISRHCFPSLRTNNRFCRCKIAFLHQLRTLFQTGYIGLMQTRGHLGICRLGGFPHGLSYVGHAAGLAVPPEHRLFVGEVYDDALTGEQLAIVWAEAWIYEASAHFHRPFQLHFDSQSAGYGASSQYGLVTGHLQERLPLSQATVLLRQLCDTRALLTFHHVKSHSGHFGHFCSELVDVLAGQERACAGIFDSEGLPTWPADVLRHPLRQWAWMASLRGSLGLPTLYSLPSEIRPFQFQREASAGAPSCDLLVRCGSANVLTMQDNSQLPPSAGGVRVTGKKELLKRQLLEARIHLIGFQETRLSEASVAPDNDFYILQSPCSPAGTHGCALWVNLSLPHGQQGQRRLCFRREHFTVSAFSVRYLVVQCEAHSLFLTIIVTHAPYSGSGWREIQGFVNRRPSTSQLLVLADANAHLASEISSAVASHQAESQNETGAAFHRFLLANDLVSPATLEAHQRGAGATWTSSTGQQHRLDYVAIPRFWLGPSVVAWVWHDFDALHAARDHRPAVLDFGLTEQTCVSAYVAPGGRARRPAPLEIQPFVEGLLALPAVAWGADVEIEIHCQALTSSWQRTYDAVAARPARVRKGSYLSESTFQVVEHRRQLQAYLVQEDAALKLSRLLEGVFALRLRARCELASDWAKQSIDLQFRAIHGGMARALAYLRTTSAHLRKCLLDQPRFQTPCVDPAFLRHGRWPPGRP